MDVRTKVDGLWTFYTKDPLKVTELHYDRERVFASDEYFQEVVDKARELYKELDKPRVFSHSRNTDVPHYVLEYGKTPSEKKREKEEKRL